ncbi:MAG: imelysin family protein [Parvibaculum sp.]
MKILRVAGTIFTLVALTLTVTNRSASADLVSQAQYVNLVQALTKETALPLHRQLAVQSARLGDVLSGFCAAPTIQGQAEVNLHFHAMMDAWQQVEPFRFGPVMSAPGPSRFQFWPDKRGTGQRQLRQALKDQDQSLLDSASLATKSVALRDLQALEVLLFVEPEALQAEGNFRCAYASAIADHQRTEAALLYDAWSKPDGFATELGKAAGGTAVFFDEREAAGAYVNALVSTLEVIRLQKLDRPMGLTLAEARPTRFENWRSERSARNIQLNLTVLKRLFTDKGGFSALLTKVGKQDDAAAVEALFDKLLDNLNALNRPLETLVQEAPARPALETLLADLRALQALIQDNVAIDLGLVPGFNATDGD